MKRLVLLFFTAFLLIATTAMASTMFDFTYSGIDSVTAETVSGSGYLWANSNGDGSWTATSGVSSAYLNTTDLGGPFNLYPITASTAPNSPSGLFTYDNLIYPLASPSLDYQGGLLFINASGSELNIFCWPNSSAISVWTEPGSNTIDGYGGYNVGADNDVTFTLTEVPEPSTLLLLGAGLLGLAATRRKS
jgi:hypothetical protein